MSTRISLPIGLRNLTAKDASRYAIGGADIRPEPDHDGSALVSLTDGRALAVRTTSAEELGGPIRVPRDSLPTGKVEAIAEREGDGDRFTIQPKTGSKPATLAVLPAEGSEGAGVFPPIADVIPDPSQYRPVCRISADLLHKVAQAISTDPETSSTRGLTILCHEDVDKSIKRPVIVLGDMDTLGVVMPITIESVPGPGGTLPGITDRLRHRVELMRDRVRRAFQTPEERERYEENRRKREAAEETAREAA